MTKHIRKIEAPPVLPTRKRVAAYARVSSDKDAMLHSLSMQVSYYNDYIQKNRKWEFAGVFADEACTGTKDNRAEFQRLLSGCRDGKIDLIITKSISRFARNTLTMLETVRELKLLNIDVYFEKENIHSLNGDGELMLTILSSFAQEESRSVSENIKWRIRKRFKDGEIVNLRFMYGFCIKKGEITVNSEQAEIVRIIFNDYINGLGCDLIAKKLRKIGAKPYKNAEWSAKRVRDILKNEKYSGNALLQKKYVADHLSKKLKWNKGILPQYFAEGTHVGIIDEATFKKAQDIMTGRRKKANVEKIVTNRYPFSGIIRCPQCGKNYKRVTSHGRVAWNCPTYLRLGKTACHCKQIPEDILFAMTAEVLGISEFDKMVFKSQIKEMWVPGFNKMVYVFQDGHGVEKVWIDKPRKKSRTENKKHKEKAREFQRRCVQCPKQDQ
jgi:site-specific DNA recombinase